MSNYLIFNVTETDCNNVAVFNASFADTLGGSNVATIEVVVSVNVSNLFVLINLWGETISWSNGNMGGNWLGSTVGRAQTMWHFPNAQQISANSAIAGFLFAPHANVSLNTDNQGSIAVYSYLGNAEVHMPTLVMPSCVTVGSS
jgi:hypothetical protein